MNKCSHIAHDLRGNCIFCGEILPHKEQQSNTPPYSAGEAQADLNDLVLSIPPTPDWEKDLRLAWYAMEGDKPVTIDHVIGFVKEILTQERQALRVKVEGMRLKHKNEAWNKLCVLSMNDVGLDEGSMELWNQALDEVLKLLN